MTESERVMRQLRKMIGLPVALYDLQIERKTFNDGKYMEIIPSAEQKRIDRARKELFDICENI